MRAIGRAGATALLALATSACIVVSSSPDENRAETFEFVPVPVEQQEAVEAFRSMVGNGPERLDEESIAPIGKIVTSAGPIVWAEFQMIDPQAGRQQCSGHAGPGSGGWGCGPIGQEVPDDFELAPVTLSASGSSGTWSEVEMRVNDDVAFLEAVAEDGTRYRMEPIAGIAWMEWKTEHGDLVVTAFDASAEPLAAVNVEAR